MKEKRVILVVEDEPDVRLLLKRRLEAHHFDVLEAPDGAAAIVRVKETPPDLVVMDLRLPGQDGLQVYQALREQEATRQTPVLFLTALSYGDTMTDEGLALIASRKHGITLDEHCAVLGKPYEPRQLIERIERLLKGRTP